MQPEPYSLEQQRQDFTTRRFLAMPLAGAIAWAIIGSTGLVLPAQQVVWVLYLGTGSIVYVGMLLTRFTGEDFFNKARPKNTFDTLFFMNIGMSLLVYAIAIPFVQLDYTSLPLTVGILAGLMWMPLSWIIQHWVGIAHAIARTLLVMGAWYVFPTARFVVIPFIIVGIYVITIVVLEYRWRAIRQHRSALHSA